MKIRRALLSVSNKAGISEFAAKLHELGIPILSTGGTAKLLQQQNIPVTEISDYTQFPEIMDGRVKSLHPKIHGGILAREDLDANVLKQQQIDLIDLVVVNLYPFEETISNPHCDLATAIENIDIGGPTLIRAAAKNHQRVSVVVDPNDYAMLIDELEKNSGVIAPNTRFNLAKKAFQHTAHYDAVIAGYLLKQNQTDTETLPETFTATFQKKQNLRYGENPHQRAAFYIESGPLPPSIATATQHQGKELSYNNIADTNAALECVKQFHEKTACVIVKHANPCGVALGDDTTIAYQKAYATDPVSAFGGIIAFNQTLSAKTAKEILSKQFCEVLIAPEITTEALTILKEKPNIRVLTCGHWQKTPYNYLEFKRTVGGLLVQDCDNHQLNPAELKIVSNRKPNSRELVDLQFAWKVCQYVKSNAIVYAKDLQTVGIGAGQMSRIHSAKIAALKAQEVDLSLNTAVMASDAFFPFRDSIDAAQKAGISAIIQPGGSIRDEEVIQAANEADIALVFTGIRHFLH